MTKPSSGKGWGTGELIPTDAGFSWRVRLGSAGRKTFKLRDGLSPAEAEDRQAVLAEMKARLKRAKAPVDRVGRFLGQAADADAATLEVILRVVDKQCGGKLVERASKSTTPTFREVAELWTSGELARRYPKRIVAKRSAADDESRLRKHIYPHAMADKPIDRVTQADCEAVLSALDPNLAQNTHRQMAQVMVRVLNLACYPLDLIPHSPLRKGFLPSPGKRKAMNYLYVDEDRRLMAEASIPLTWRLLWGFLAREGMRISEACALNWSSVDLDRGTVRLDENKTNSPRAWALDPGVARALRAWREVTSEPTGASDPVFVDTYGRRVNHRGCAEILRRHLVAIGLDKERPELFERSAARQPIRVHDLRATFITISLASGKTETWVSDRTGHESSEMIHEYKRDARMAAEINQGELTPLDEAIPELTPPANLGPQLGRWAEILGGFTFQGSDPECEPKRLFARKTSDPESLAGDQTTPNGQPSGQAIGQSQDQSSDPRGALLSALSLALKSGDAATARIAHKALGDLLGEGGEGQPIVDLASERKRRGGK